LAATFFFNLFDLGLWTTFLITIVVLILLAKAFPAIKKQNLDILPPKWDIPLRIVLATFFIVGLTYLSDNIGPNLSGLLSTFPIFSTIFATTTHYLYGYNAARGLLKAVIISLMSSCVFFVIIALYIKPLSITHTFLLATIVCLVVQSLVFFRGKLMAVFNLKRDTIA
jgi:uncharacterized membrane protein (GlpM family)